MVECCHPPGPRSRRLSLSSTPSHDPHHLSFLFSPSPFLRRASPLAIAAMEEESSAITQLGSLALGNLLSEIGIEAEAGMDRVGLGTRNSAVSRDQIYNEQFEDDDDEELRGMTAGGEEEDEEAKQRAAQEKQMQDRYFAKGLASMQTNRPGIRGETDDFDDDEDSEDDEDERPMQARSQQQQQQQRQALLLPGAPRIKTEPDEGLDAFDDDDVDMPEAGPSSPRSSLHTPTPPPMPPPPRDVREFWPDFDPNAILDFTDFFAAPRRKKRRVAAGRQLKIAGSKAPLERVPSTAELALMPSTGQDADAKLSSHLAAIAGDLLKEEKRLARARLGKARSESLDLPETSLSLPELDDWENRIVTDGNLALPPMQAAGSVSRPINRSLTSDEWIQAIIWSREQARDPRKVELNSRLVLDLNDEDMMIERVDPAADKARASAMLASNAPLLSRRAAAAAATQDPLNMSNDGYYELSREQRQRIQRQTLGALVVQHTKTARKLQLPFYKTRLTKTEARSFHRPAMQFPINIPLTFSRVEKAGGKKDKKRSSKDADEVLRSTRELTLKEQGAFILYEYSEEHPPIPSKIGMGSILVNYYRKKDAKDEYIPKLDLGEPFILEPNDESPFLKFGSVEPGRTQPTLYNNLVRAPLFRHQPATTDFLLVRVTTKNAVRYYLRDIKNLFVVGQNYPLSVIPGPHARLVTNAIRNRLIMVARRLVEQSKGNRIKIHRIMKYFPDQSELQMRQRLKEFMEYARKAGDPNQGFWRLRSTVQLPSDADMERLLPPEHIALAEAMQAGQRRLYDAGYTRSAEGADEDEDKEQGLDIEQQLAPWITSKNFLMATQGKAMLRLHGEGDPTGRGEGFSFVRVSMKDVFYKAGEDIEARMAQQAEEERRSGHKYNVARQQQIYREEIQRIWDAQRTSLANPVPPELTPEEANPLPTPEPEDEEEDEEDAQQHAEDVKPVAGLGGVGEDINQGKVLRIRRLVDGHWTTEIVRDRKVIQSYISSRLRIADEDTTTDELRPTGDAALDAARRKRLEAELLSRKKNQERRLARHHAKAVANGEVLPGTYRKLMADKPTTSRRCGRCGQVGHMSSNRSCPLWGQVPATGAPGTVSSASGSKAMGGLDLMGSVPGTPSTVPASPATPASAGVGGGSFFPPGAAAPPSLTHSRTPSFSAAGSGGSGGAMGPPMGRPPSAAGAMSPPPAPGTPSGSTSGSGGGGGGGGGGGKIKLKLKGRPSGA